MWISVLEGYCIVELVCVKVLCEYLEVFDVLVYIDFEDDFDFDLMVVC